MFKKYHIIFWYKKYFLQFKYIKSILSIKIYWSKKMSKGVDTAKLGELITEATEKLGIIR